MAVGAEANGEDEDRVLLYDVLTGKQVGQVRFGKEGLANYSLSPDGTMLFASAARSTSMPG